MPIHDLGYRHWQGCKSPQSMRWWVIAISGVRIVWKNLWLRRMLMVAWLPAIYIGMGFFAYEQYVERYGMDSFTRIEESFTDQAQRRFQRRFGQRFLTSMVQDLWDGELIAKELEEDPEAARHLVWAWLLMWFFRYPQGMLMLLVVGMIAPGLIAKDVRSRAFLLYFSRPLSPLEYLLGKASIVWCYLVLITTLPALMLYIIAVSLSPSIWVTLETWDLPLRVLVASIVLMLPTTALALLFSSLTPESRFAGFAWFTVWTLGYVAYGSIYNTRQEMDQHWTAVSLYHTLGNVQMWIFGIDTPVADVWYSLAILAGLTVFSTLVLIRRVSAPIRV